MSLTSCHCCGLVQAAPNALNAWCVRCQSSLRVAGASGRDNTPTAAIAIVALAFYPLAILAPFLKIERLGYASESSLIGGIEALFEARHFLVGGIVLLFSVILPAVKLITLLTLSLRARWLRESHRAATYRFVEQLGRWGMLDVLLVAVLVAFVKLGDLVSFDVGPGLYLFSGFVVLNLIAGMAFDPHLLWDEAGLSGVNDDRDDQRGAASTVRSGIVREASDQMEPAKTQPSRKGEGEMPTTDSLPIARRDPPGRKLWWLVAVAGVAAAGAIGAILWPEPPYVVRVSFSEGHGLAAGNAVQYRGIPVGRVRSLSLDADSGRVDVDVEVSRDVTPLMRAGTEWWIVRPQLSLAGAAGLETLLGDKSLTFRPGDGPPTTSFVGLEERPLVDLDDPGGLRVIVQAVAGPRLRTGAGVYHRGVRVGGVSSVQLASDASAIEYHLYIRPQFSRLVTRDARFWNTAGASLNVGLDGLSLRLDSFEELLTGGIAIAVPEAGAPVADEFRFELFDDAEPEWLDWRPSLRDATLTTRPHVPSLGIMTITWQPRGLLSRWGGPESRRGVVVKRGDTVVVPRMLLPNPLPSDAVIYVDGQLMASDAVSVSADESTPYGSAFAMRSISVPEDVSLASPSGLQNVSAAQWIADDAGYVLPSRFATDDGTLVLAGDGSILAITFGKRMVSPGDCEFVEIRAQQTPKPTASNETLD